MLYRQAKAKKAAAKVDKLIQQFKAGVRRSHYGGAAIQKASCLFNFTVPIAIEAGDYASDSSSPEKGH